MHTEIILFINNYSLFDFNNLKITDFTKKKLSFRRNFEKCLLKINNKFIKKNIINIQFKVKTL